MSPGHDAHCSGEWLPQALPPRHTPLRGPPKDPVLTSSSLLPSERLALPRSMCRTRCTCKEHRGHPAGPTLSSRPKGLPFWGS